MYRAHSYVVLFFASCSLALSAAQAECEIDNVRAPLSWLRSHGNYSVDTVRDGDHYQVYASGIIKADIDRYHQAVLKYDQYRKMGMTGIIEMRVLERTGTPEDETAFVWSKQDQGPIDISNYITFHAYRLADRSSVMEYTLTDPKIVRKKGWTLEKDDTLAKMRGKVQTCPLGNGELYVNYYLSVNLDTILPNWIISGWVKDGLKVSLVRMIRAIRADANAK